MSIDTTPGERPAVHLPETRGYKLKNRLLGPALATEALEHERLGIPTAVAVFSSDCISSSAYATEEILRVLFVAVGIASFALVVPVTVAMLVVLFFLMPDCLSCYRCGARYRGEGITSQFGGFDLETHEKHRQLVARTGQSTHDRGGRATGQNIS